MFVAPMACHRSQASPSLEDPIPSPPRPRSHLKSRTFTALLRILPVCYHESMRLPAADAAQIPPKPDDGAKESGGEAGIKFHDESVAFNSAEPDNPLMQLKDVIDEDFEASCLDDAGFGEALSALENELQDVLGIEENRGNDNGDSVPDDQAGNQQAVSTGDENVRDLRLQIANPTSKISDAADTSFVEDTTAAACKLFETGQGNASMSEVARKNVAEIKRLAPAAKMIDSSVHVATEEGIEEGEISTDDIFIKDDVALEENVKEGQVSKEKVLMNGLDITCIEQGNGDGKNNESTSYFNTASNPNHSIKEDFKEENRKVIKYDYDTVFYEPSDIQSVTSSEKDAGGSNKRKRGKLSEGRKEKKKRKERIKRAEKNRKLGVKRLKLQPVPSSKPISICRHYLHGRCQQGDDCKFSHDAVPLTKSKPCCYFARQACMKGEKCPFDHQLSKYPCNSYASNGSCSRGDKCQFSHKVTQPEGSPAISLPALSDPKKQPNAPHKASQHNNGTLNGISHWSKNAPKGINLPSFGKSVVDSSDKPNEAPKKDVSLTTEGHSKGILSETLNRAPLKGINFLSFGEDPFAKTPSSKRLNDSGKFKLPGLEINAGAKARNDHGMVETSPSSAMMPGANLMSFKDGEDKSDKFRGSGSVPWWLGRSSLGVNELSGNRLSSTPKALMSTLAFASQLESGIRMDQSAAADSVVNKNPRDSGAPSNSGNEPLKASAILDFLYSKGKK